MDNGAVYGRFDYNWRDDMFIGNDNDPNKIADSSGIANVKVGYRFSEDRYDISVLWGTILSAVPWTIHAPGNDVRTNSMGEYCSA